MAQLSLRSVSKHFGDAAVLSDVDLEVGDGEMLVLVGPSGCGKSTLLRIVAGLAAPGAGEVWLDGRRVDALPPGERDVAMVFQNYALYPHMSVRGNLAFPLRMARWEKERIAARVEETAALLGLGALLGRKPATLSGGQMQRVALGRAIVRNPRLFLFDEPLSNLDAKLRIEMRGEIARLHARLAITSLYVTHDQAEAMTMGARVCVLDRGRVRQVGTPLEVFERPADTFVAAFLGSPGMNLVHGAAHAGRFVAADWQVAAPPALDGPVILGVRPHELELRPGGALEVTAVEALGSHSLVRLRAGAQELVVSVPGSTGARRGTRLEVAAAGAALHWFDVESGARLASGA